MGGETERAMQVLLVVNPQAGRRRGQAAADSAAQVFREAGWRVTMRTTECAGDAERVAREAAGEGFDAIFGCGGDGTLSQVLTGLLDSGVPGGVVPAGTGNDLCRCVGLSGEPAEAARQLLGGTPAHVDLLNVDDGRRWAINIVGVGFDARVAARTNRRRRLTGGLLAYLSAVAGELMRHRPTHVRMSVDGERWEGPALLVAAANGRSYGAGMMIAPEARVDDGLMDVVLVRHMGRARFVRSFPHVMRGTHLALPEVTAWQARELRIEMAEPSPLLVDGDLQGETPATIRVARGRALMWLPAAGRSADDGPGRVSEAAQEVNH